MPVTASHLYAFVTCPHRVWRDAHDDPSEKDPVNEFVQMLWEKGTQHEQNVIMTRCQGMNLVDLSAIPKPARFAATMDAIRNGAAYIYQGRLEVDDLAGEPDLLARQPDGDYLPIDIKSGMALEGENDEHDGKLKKTYAVQLGLYIDALRRLNLTKELRGKIWDSSGAMVDYVLDTPRGKRTPETWWEFYNDILVQVRAILAGTIRTESALIGDCRFCHWYSSCKRQCHERRDISLVFELGRSRKESLNQIALDVDCLAAIDCAAIGDGKDKTGIGGIGQRSLQKFVRRAKVLTKGGTTPTILKPFAIPDKPIELFFDIEADPTQDIVYLHGVVERQNGRETFREFHAVSVSPDAERRAWAEFWAYFRSLPRNDIAVYYYSKYERTQYRQLQEKYPDVATIDEVEAFFDPSFAIDLYYDIVLPCTDWPTSNYSVKALAQLLGFRWRDANPSGAASIQWFNEWCKDQQTEKLQRILDYNEDDCRAMRVLKDCLVRVGASQGFAG